MHDTDKSNHKSSSHHGRSGGGGGGSSSKNNIEFGRIKSEANRGLSLIDHIVNECANVKWIFKNLVTDVETLESNFSKLSKTKCSNCSATIKDDKPPSSPSKESKKEKSSSKAKKAVLPMVSGHTVQRPNIKIERVDVSRQQPESSSTRRNSANDNRSSRNTGPSSSSTTGRSKKRPITAATMASDNSDDEGGARNSRKRVKQNDKSKSKRTKKSSSRSSSRSSSNRRKRSSSSSSSSSSGSSSSSSSSKSSGSSVKTGKSKHSSHLSKKSTGVESGKRTAPIIKKKKKVQDDLLSVGESCSDNDDIGGRKIANKNKNRKKVPQPAKLTSPLNHGSASSRYLQQATSSSSKPNNMSAMKAKHIKKKVEVFVLNISSLIGNRKTVNLNDLDEQRLRKHWAGWTRTVKAREVSPEPEEEETLPLPPTPKVVREESEDDDDFRPVTPDIPKIFKKVEEEKPKKIGPKSKVTSTSSAIKEEEPPIPQSPKPTPKPKIGPKSFKEALNKQPDSPATRSSGSSRPKIGPKSKVKKEKREENSASKPTTLALQPTAAEVLRAKLREKFNTFKMEKKKDSSLSQATPDSTSNNSNTDVETVVMVSSSNHPELAAIGLNVMVGGGNNSERRDSATDWTEFLETKRRDWVGCRNDKTGIGSLREDVQVGLRRLMDGGGSLEWNNGKEDVSSDCYIIGNYYCVCKEGSSMRLIRYVGLDVPPCGSYNEDSNDSTIDNNPPKGFVPFDLGELSKDQKVGIRELGTGWKKEHNSSGDDDEMEIPIPDVNDYDDYSN